MRRSRLLAVGVALCVTAAAVAACVAATPDAQGDPSYPTTPPAAVCGNTTLLDGPTSAPAGAVIVPPGAHTPTELLALEADNTTFYFQTGVHYFLGGEYSQIAMGQNSTYIGAPGAIIDGSGDPANPADTTDDNRYAFSGQNTGVTIKHLTVRNFKAPRDEGVVNHNSGDGWTIEKNTFTLNQGAAMMAGANNTIRDNCLKDNGQYGLNAYKEGNTITDLVVTGNEFVGNSTRDWETEIPGCGCTGAMKFWAVDGADVTNNWIHDNRGVGIWADTNNNDFLIQGNLIDGNDGTGIFYEISYNAVIRDNNIRNNAWVTGQKFADDDDGFPTGAIYLSETDGDSRVPARTDKIEVTANLMENNWGGVVGWANADRFCGSYPINPTRDCTAILGWQNDEACVAPDIASEPLYTDCRWWTSGLDIHHNTFDFDPAEVAGGCDTKFCGYSALMSNYGSSPSWSPYMGNVIQQATVFNGGNSWHDNTYIGPWQFKAPDMSTKLSPYQWTHAPYNQDAGSTFDGGAPTSPTGTPSSTTTSPSTPPSGPTPLADYDFEVGPYTPQYGSAVEVKRGGAHGGRWSLLVSSLDPYGAVEGTVLPGHPVVAGKTYDFSAWYREVAAPMETVQWEITWHDAATNDLRVDDILMPMGADWAEAAGSLVAPPGATHVTWIFTWGDGLADTSFQLDDVHVEAVN